MFQAGQADWGRGKLGNLEVQNFQFGSWKPVESSVESGIQITTTTAKPFHKILAPKQKLQISPNIKILPAQNFPTDSEFQVKNLDALHNYAHELYNRKTPRALRPVAQNRISVYIKPLGEMGGILQGQEERSDELSIQNGHQADPETLYTTPYDNIGDQEPWIPTIRNNTISVIETRAEDFKKDADKIQVDRTPKNKDFDPNPKPFGDTILQTSVSVSGNNLQDDDKPRQYNRETYHNIEKHETSTESVNELSTSSNRKYYYYPTSFPTNQNPFPSKRIHPKLLLKRPRAEFNKIKPPNYKIYVPPPIVNERKDVVPLPSKKKAKTIYYHTPKLPEAPKRNERDCKCI